MAGALALMAHYGHQHFTVVGHSISGMIVQYLMLHAPERPPHRRGPNYRRETIEKTFGPWYPNLIVTSLHDSEHYSMIEEPGLFAAELTRALAGDAKRG